QLEDLLEALDVILALAEVRLEALLELLIVSVVDHFRQRFHDLFFSIVDVSQRVHEQIVHVLDVLREQTHDCHFPYFDCDWKHGRLCPPDYLVPTPACSDMFRFGLWYDRSPVPSRGNSTGDGCILPQSRLTRQKCALGEKIQPARSILKLTK